MKLSLPWIFFLLFPFLSVLAAGDDPRLVDLPPIQTQTTHSGYMFNGTLNVGCTSGNTLHQPRVLGGVTSANHQIRLSFHNVSTIEQTVKLGLRKGSFCQGHYSNGANWIPGTGGAISSLGSDYLSDEITLAAGEQKVVTLMAVTRGPDCVISVHNVVVEGPVIARCSGAQQVCLALTSNLYPYLELRPKNGAVTANVTSIAHRCEGANDVYQQGPHQFALFEGRPF